MPTVSCKLKIFLLSCRSGYVYTRMHTQINHDPFQLLPPFVISGLSGEAVEHQLRTDYPSDIADSKLTAGV